MPQLARMLPPVLLLTLMGATVALPDGLPGAVPQPASGSVPDVVAGPVRTEVSDTLDDPATGIRMDFTVHGGTVTEASRDGFDYDIRGTVRPGETISVAISGNGTTFTPDHHANDDLEGSVSIDFPGPDHDERAVLPVGTAVSLAGSYVVPGDESTIEIAALLGNAWINPNGGGSRTLVVRCVFEVVEAPPEPQPEPEPEPDPEPRPTEEPVEHECDEESYHGAVGWTRENAIVRFGDLTGEVNVRPDWEDDDAYIFAELDTPLVHCDRIRTHPRSGAILSFSDMTTFVMREDSIVVLDIANERETMLGIVAGNIWVNLKQMVEHGTMEVEMAQAIAGAKGTTFICEETGEESTVKVVEGTVEVTPDVGEPLTLEGGEMVTVTASGPGPVRSFDIDEEMADWPATAQEITADALAGAGGAGSAGSTDLATLLVVLGVVALGTGLLGLGLALRRRA